jgi:hypothetical protein
MKLCAASTVWTGIAPRCLAQFARAGVGYTLPPVQEGSVA